MVNSVTVLGTTELSSRPTKEEQKPQVKVSGSCIYTAHNTGAPGGTPFFMKPIWVQGSAPSWGTGRLGMLELEDTLHADPTPSLYRIPGAKEKKNYLLGGFLTN